MADYNLQTLEPTLLEEITAQGRRLVAVTHDRKRDRIVVLDPIPELLRQQKP